MEIIGTLIQILPPKEGVSHTTGRIGKQQEFVVAYNEQEQYPKKICLKSGRDDVLSNLPKMLNTKVKCLFDIDSHEWNGRWFPEVTCWRIENV